MCFSGNVLLWMKQGKPWPQTCGQTCNSVSPAHTGAFPAEWICPRMGWICFPHLPRFPHLQQLPVLTSNPLLDSAVRWVPLTSGLCGVPEVLAGGGCSDRSVSVAGARARAPRARGHLFLLQAGSWGGQLGICTFQPLIQPLWRLQSPAQPSLVPAAFL